MFKTYGERGISNNDNSFSSPMYGLGYTPSIIDLKQKDANGNWILDPWPVGTKAGGANPWQTFDYMQNDEDVYRIIAAARLAYSMVNDKFKNFTARRHGPLNNEATPTSRRRSNGSNPDHS